MKITSYAVNNAWQLVAQSATINHYYKCYIIMRIIRYAWKFKDHLQGLLQHIIIFHNEFQKTEINNELFLNLHYARPASRVSKKKKKLFSLEAYLNMLCDVIF